MGRAQLRQGLLGRLCLFPLNPRLGSPTAVTFRVHPDDPSAVDLERFGTRDRRPTLWKINAATHQMRFSLWKSKFHIVEVSIQLYV